MQLGVIADDFTGATDIASFLVNNGMSTIQLTSIPKQPINIDCNIQAVVISLKSRSCAVNIAVKESVEALRWLKEQGCSQFYFKYCSTFDSTDKGNIGPVIDALLDELEESFTVISPSLPINGRTVYQGYLFVMDKLLSDSGMKNHPINPMTESSLIKLIERQASGKCGLIPYCEMEKGEISIRQQLTRLKQENYRYVVLDTLTDEHLVSQGKAVKDLKLVTGGSGLAIGVAKNFAKSDVNSKQAQILGKPQGHNKTVLLSGSCSLMTNKQVEFYKTVAPTYTLNIEKCINEPEDYCQVVIDWTNNHQQQKYAPLVSATTDIEQLNVIQQTWGVEKSSQAVEYFFKQLVIALEKQGYDKYIVAGGETSGVVVQALNVHGFYIGPTIAPGVPWVRSINKSISLALKSGNFGDESFFVTAQGDF